MIGGEDHDPPDKRFARDAGARGGTIVCARCCQRQADRHVTLRRVGHRQAEPVRLTIHVVGRRADERVGGDALGSPAEADEKAEARGALVRPRLARPRLDDGGRGRRAERIRRDRWHRSSKLPPAGRREKCDLHRLGRRPENAKK